MILLTANASANATVQRLRLRSTSEPPPSGPLPVPTPKAPDSPASFPECMSPRKIRKTQMATWVTDGMNSIAHPSLAGLPLGGCHRRHRVELAQDVHRLRPQLAVHHAP